MSLTTLETLKRELKVKLPAGVYAIWIEPLVALDETELKLTLGCPNRFSRDWVSQHYYPELRRAVDLFWGPTVALDLAVAPSQRPAASAPPAQVQPELPYPLGLTLGAGRGPFNPVFTFDRFVTGPSNQFAHQAALALAKGQGLALNVLYLAAETGLGKSHLAQAVGLSLLGGARRPTVLYLTAEEFTSQMIAAIRTNQVAAFKDRFRRQCEVLILDEVQFLAGKDKTQEELSATLDSLLNDGRRLVFSSSRLPAQIPGLEPGLASRLTAGVVATIDRPDFETRLKILQAKARHHDFDLPEGVAQVLAQAVTSDVRRLESALLGLAARSRLLGRPVSLDLAREVLQAEGTSLRPGMDEVVTLVCQYYRLTPQDLSSQGRQKKVSQPRAAVFYLTRQFTDLSLAAIGRTLGRKHTTVLYALDQVERALGRRDGFGREVEFLSKKLKERYP